MKTLALRLSALGGFAFGAALWFTGCRSPDPMTVYTTIPSRHTTVSIVGPAFHLNGKPTYEGRTWNGKRIQGLLMNSRMVQAVAALRELLFRFATERAIAGAVEVLRLDERGAALRVGFGRYDPARHEGADVKAVTYHLARFGREGDRFRAQVVFDI